MSEEKKPIAIWFFIGCLLLIYGVLIFGSALYDLVTGVQRDTVLAEVHIGVWWGILLIIIGSVYVYFFSPRRHSK